jgi:hypothetical protein
MAANDYVQVIHIETTVVNNVEFKRPIIVLVPMSSLIESLGAKLDVDKGIVARDHRNLVDDGDDTN